MMCNKTEAAMKKSWRLKKVLQLFPADSRIFQDLDKSPSGYILAGMIRNCDSSFSFRVGKYIMTPRNPLQYETFLFENHYYFLR
jgi:hypothetical protein